MQEYENFELKNYTSFKIGGNARKVYFPETVEEFSNLLQSIDAPIILGGMSNVLISSEGINGNVIISKKLNKFEISGKTIKAQAGAMGPLVAKSAAQAGLSGMEFMCGFPGSIGGIVCMNAGAHGQCISDIFSYAKVFDLNSMQIKTLYPNNMGFGYRTSTIQQEPLIVLEVEFNLTPKDKNEILSKMETNQEFRKNKQPNLSKPNCGSVFKNPKDNSAGRLLELAGAKELCVGNVQVFENHANFIINNGGARSEDVSLLMKKMYNKVKEKFGIKLIPEVKFIGEMNEVEKEIWKEFLNN